MEVVSMSSSIKEDSVPVVIKSIDSAQLSTEQAERSLAILKLARFGTFWSNQSLERAQTKRTDEVLKNETWNGEVCDGWRWQRMKVVIFRLTFSWAKNRGLVLKVIPVTCARLHEASYQQVLIRFFICWSGSANESACLPSTIRVLGLLGSQRFKIQGKCLLFSFLS